jgi:hypothetical protein
MKNIDTTMLGQFQNQISKLWKEAKSLNCMAVAQSMCSFWDNPHGILANDHWLTDF